MTRRAIEDEDEAEVLGEVEIDTAQFGAITSVAAHGDLVAVSVTDAGSKTAPGWVLIYRFPSAGAATEYSGRRQPGHAHLQPARRQAPGRQ